MTTFHANDSDDRALVEATMTDPPVHSVNQVWYVVDSSGGRQQYMYPPKLLP